MKGYFKLIDMKKVVRTIYALFAAGMIVTSFAACTGPAGTDGIDGKDADYEESFPVEVITDWSKIKSQNAYFRGFSSEGVCDTQDYFELFFLNDTDIPYLLFSNGDEWRLSLAYTFTGEGNKQNYEFIGIEEDASMIALKNNKTKTFALFDLEKRKLIFENYDEFFRTSPSYFSGFDLASRDFIKLTDCGNISGRSISLSWADQDIHIALVQGSEDDDKFYLAIPLQFFNDVFLSPSLLHIFYNGKNLYRYFLNDSIIQDYYDTAVLPAGGKRSAAMTEFCYNEFCLNMDFNYGLGLLHGISKEGFADFDSYFTQVGIKEDLLSESAETFANAVADVVHFYFNDGHSAYERNSAYLPRNPVASGTKTSSMKTSYLANRGRYWAARNEQFANEANYAPCYEVSTDGKTAIVRFDSFTDNNYNREQRKDISILDEDAAKYAGQEEAVPLGNHSQGGSVFFDTISLLHYVNEKIKAPGSTVENVVLDLSCNGGGQLSAMVCVISWMLGEAQISLTNSVTGAKIYSTYKVDIDFDGTAGGDGDSVKDKNLFCLISPVSFSCGNAAPAILKESSRVTILGATSSGGTAAVQDSSCADGTAFCMSSKYVISVSKNGSNYDIDRGVEPHFYINQPKNFYDKEKIAEFVGKVNSGFFLPRIDTSLH